MKVGVIGVGVIGGALLKALTQKGFKAIGYDNQKQEYKSNWRDLLESQLLFVCVPTLTVDRMQDLVPIHDVFWSLSDSNYQGVVVLRCTVLPGVTDSLIAKYPNLKVAHNPEFLTAKSPLQDLINQPAVLIGSQDKEIGDLVEKFWRLFDSTLLIKHGNPKETEIAKYVHNCFLATKVSLLNDFYEICGRAGVFFDHVMNLAHSIGQVGLGHSQVPGPDGKLGFGGMCFPKDTEALSFWCEVHGLPAETLNGAIKGNHRRRPRWD